MQDAFPLLLLVGFFLVMWLLFIRPQQRRQRELALMQGSLDTGDEVMLTSGVYGVLRALEEETVRVEVADGVVITVARQAIGRLVAPEEPEVQSEHEQRSERDEDDDVSEEN